MQIRHLCHASSCSRDQQRNIDGRPTTFSTADDLGRKESTDPTDRHEMQCRMSLRVFFSSMSWFGLRLQQLPRSLKFCQLIVLLSDKNRMK